MDVITEDKDRSIGVFLTHLPAGVSQTMKSATGAAGIPGQAGASESGAASDFLLLLVCVFESVKVCEY
jgi:hypothetical protein